MESHVAVATPSHIRRHYCVTKVGPCRQMGMADYLSARHDEFGGDVASLSAAVFRGMCEGGVGGVLTVDAA